MKPYLGGAGMLALACGVAPSWGQALPTAAAQATQPQPDDVSTSQRAGQAPAGVPEIIVTAQRRSESAQRAAIAIDVVSPAELRNAGVVTSSTLNATTPALVVTKAGGATTNYYVRGVGNFTVNAYADPSVAFNVDGVYIGRPTGTVGTFYDLDRIEVLKGRRASSTAATPPAARSTSSRPSPSSANLRIRHGLRTAITRPMIWKAR